MHSWLPSQEVILPDKLQHCKPRFPVSYVKAGKEPERVRVRSLVCYWAVNDLGMNGTQIAKLLGVGQSLISRAVRRGEQLALETAIDLESNA